MNLELTTTIRTAINNTLSALRPPVMGAHLPEATRAALQTHLDALLKAELRALTGQALEGNLVAEYVQAELGRVKGALQRADALYRQWVDPRKDPEPTPWYPDDSGEWVEGHPRDLPPDTLMAGWLVMAEREAKSYTIPESGWPAKALTNQNIVAYKVVKPCEYF